MRGSKEKTQQQRLRSTIRITSPSSSAEITKGPEGEEVLPITYEDNYTTLFPKESRTLQARYNPADVPGRRAEVRLEGTT